VAVTLRRKLAVIAGVYVIEGFPLGVFREVWPVYFRTQGLSLSAIGAMSGLYLAWSLKFLWSPLVDRFGEYRRWIAGALLGMSALLLALAGHDPRVVGVVLGGLLVGYCLASATQDIAIDAYTIGIIEHGEEGQANAVRITAYRVGLILAGWGILLLSDLIGWPGAWCAAAALSLLAAGLVLRAPAVRIPREARRQPFAALGRWLSRGGAAPVFAFVLLYRVGDLALGPMLKPFWVDRGFSTAEIAWISNFLGAIATTAGAIVGGAIVARFGIGRALWVVGILAMASNLAYAGAALVPETGPAGVYVASVVESACGGLAAAGFLAFLMRICEKEHAAVQYASLTALYALPGTFAGALSGRAVELIGYGEFFALTALLALPAFAFLPRARRWLGENDR
jgi:PAT family beta-lactamase induction signal transducer AmpG